MVEFQDDFALALQLQSQFDEEHSNRSDDDVIPLNKIISNHQDDELSIIGYSQSRSGRETPKEEMSLVDPRWEMIDPIPDVRALFVEFNDKYFWGRLASVEVRWSPRMTLCAGLCVYEGRGGMCSVRLSEPLLKLRPRKDLIETLLHEMIHAYLFVTDNNKDHDGHGPEFCKHMKRLNDKCGTNITIYHSFHDEVDNYRQHWWRCDGPCQQWKPYFGYVKRAMNRAPSPRDPWWGQHQQKCGGKYTKIKEPEGYGKKKEKAEKKSADNKSQDKKSGDRDIRSLFGNKSDEKKPVSATQSSNSTSTLSSSNTSTQSSSSTATQSSNTPSTQSSPESSQVSHFSGNGVTIGGSSATNKGPIVRKLPGFGVIKNERTENDTHNKTNSTEHAEDNDEIESTPMNNENNKRRLHSCSDGEDSAQKKQRIDDKGRSKERRSDGHLRRKSSSLTDFFKDKIKSPPGTTEKVPGFKSVSNRNNWSEKIKKNTKPIQDSSMVYTPIGKRPNIRPNVSIEFKNKGIGKAEKGASNSENIPGTSRFGSIWDENNERDTGTHHSNHRTNPPKDESRVDNGARGSVDGDSAIAGASGRTTESATTGAIVRNDSSLTDIRTDNSPISAFTRVIPTQQNNNSRIIDVSDMTDEQQDIERALAESVQIKQVDCPVCTAKVNEQEINAHLDICLNGL